MKRMMLGLALVLFPGIHGQTADAANRLADSDSPYLIQHKDNPVDWYPWGAEALERARTENKPILVSVGYSSCHWCHVMEEESFMDADIAALMNLHYVSIKIDRESRPDLDEQFMLATQLLTGGGGWPNTVFLTPDGDPFYAGTYFPPDNFRTALQLVAQAWQEEPGRIGPEAAKVTQAIANYLTRQSEATEITPEVVAGLTGDLIGTLDEFNGGYGVAPKFPRETLFLFLLEQAERTGDLVALEAVTAMLDGMIRGGIHDHVGGGFHRYAVDPEWHVPHFEKMLYNQALIGRLLVRAWGVTGEPRYRRAAERLMDYVLREMRDPDGGFYAAQDADSLGPNGEKTEGAYYTWTPAQLGGLAEDGAFVAEVFQISADGDLDGANVLNMAGLPTELAAGFALTPEAFIDRLDTALTGMQRMRKTRPAPFLDRKIVVSWNAEMIRTLAEAGRRLDRPDYHAAAESAARFILFALRDENGLHRVFFEGEAHVPAQLPDYAGLGLAFLALHDTAITPEDRAFWLREAEATAREIAAGFADADGGFRMLRSSEGLTHMLPVDDTEIPSGNALALSLFTGLSRRIAVPEFERISHELAAAMSGHAVTAPEQRGYLLKALQDRYAGEAGPVRHLAKGHVRAELNTRRGSGDVVIALSVADGWHINAHQPLDDYFVATELAPADGAVLTVTYPEPVVKALAFNATALALYEGDLTIAARMENTDRPRGLTLTLQACSDEICLQPEDVRFTLW